MSESLYKATQRMNIHYDIENYGEIEYWGLHTPQAVQDTVWVFGKEYLHYATREKKFQFRPELPDYPLKTFHEILQDEFDGDLEEAMNEFLIPEFYYTSLRDMVNWKQETGNGATCNNEVLNIMKWVVVKYSVDDLKELLELEPCLK